MPRTKSYKVLGGSQNLYLFEKNTIGSCTKKPFTKYCDENFVNTKNGLKYAIK